MDKIFFEKQEGQLCAQHALNALLQGSYFSAPDLAEIARKLDSQERGVFSEHGSVDSADYLAQFQFDSQNMDDSGFFSIQVLSEAIKIWNLELVPYQSASDENAINARKNPTSQKAYICNFREHWFTIRRFGSKWFNLNSVKNFPELISDTYLSLFLTQLQNDGYSIFVVKGDLPHCPADDVNFDDISIFNLASNSAADTGEINTGTSQTGSKKGGFVPADDYERAQMEEAIRLSLQASPQASASTGSYGKWPEAPENDGMAEEDEETTLREALLRSREELDEDDPSLRQVLAESLAEFDDQDLKLALQMSLNEDTASSSKATANEVNLEELRHKRLQYLTQKEKDNNDK